MTLANVLFQHIVLPLRATNGSAGDLRLQAHVARPRAELTKAMANKHVMTNEDKILKIADQLAVVSRHRIVNLERGIAELKVRLKGKADRRATEIEKPKRRKAFKAIENGMIQCPWCWVLHGCSNIVRCSSCNHSLFVG